MFFSFFSTPIYKSSIVFTPEISNSNNNSQISGLANLAGIDISSNNSKSLSISLYPLIFDDILFKRKVLNINLNDTIKLKEYLKMRNETLLYHFRSFIFNLPSKILSPFKSKDSIKKYNLSNLFINDDEIKLFSYLNSIIFLDINNREKYIEISSEIDNAYYSSVIVIKVQEILQNIIINHNIKSSIELLEFNKKNYDLKKIEFEDIQNRLSIFKDKNQNISTSFFNNEQFKLQNEFDLVNSVYQELAKQVEQAKIQVTKNTPIFTILKNAEIPRNKHYPKTIFITFLYTCLGLFFSIAYIFLKDPLFLSLKKIIN